MFFNIIKQELVINIKNLSGLTHSLMFFLITISIFAITTNIDNGAVAIAIMWICLTFAILLATNGQFQKDFDDGTFEQLYLSGYAFELIILAKIFANWLFNVVPLIVALPLIAMILKLPSSVLFVDLILIASVASLIINFMVSFGASLTLSTSTTSSLLTILILPLLIPIIIFANTALDNNFTVSIKFLLALLIFLSPILTFATAAAVRINVKE